MLQKVCPVVFIGLTELQCERQRVWMDSVSHLHTESSLSEPLSTGNSLADRHETSSMTMWCFIFYLKLS